MTIDDLPEGAVLVADLARDMYPGQEAQNAAMSMRQRLRRRGIVPGRITIGGVTFGWLTADQAAAVREDLRRGRRKKTT